MTTYEFMLEDVKKYLRVDLDEREDDHLILSLIAAAKSYIEGQTGKTYNPQSELWNTLIKMLTAHWYENRGNEITGTISNKISHAVDAIVNHIAMCGDYQ